MIFNLKRELILVGLLFLGIFLIRTFVFEPFHIPSHSMFPTLLSGDFVLVNKLSYDQKKEGYPRRGDIIVFHWPQDKKLYYIKRIVGLPGDSISMKNKVLYINDKPIPSRKINRPPNFNLKEFDFGPYDLGIYQIKMDSKKYYIQKNEDNIFQQDFSIDKIPDGQYFVLGDNRDFSYDSRFWGFVPRENILGKAVNILMSLDFEKEDSYFPELRSGRLFHKLN